MKQDFVWLSASLFCSKEYWRKLIDEGIKPFIRTNENQIKRFQIRINLSYGDCIQFAVLVPNAEKRNVKRKETDHFTNFFSSFPRDKTEILEKDDAIGPFPNFSIYYELYNVIWQENLINSIKTREEFYQIQEELSSILVSMLSGKIEEETILTLAFYLNIGLISVVQDYYTGDITELVGFDQVEVSYIHALETDTISAIAKENSNVMSEITSNILNSTESYKFDWIDNWISLCKRQLKDKENNNGEIENSNIIEIYNLFLNLIVIHLGLSRKMEIMLFYFVKYSLVTLGGRSLTEEKNKALCNHQLKVDEINKIYKKIDKNTIPVNDNEIRLFVIARNESLRLPYFLDYYSKLGVNRFFLIDNNSTDNTQDIALSYDEDVHVFQINESYKNHWLWMEHFLETYAKNNWCLVVDVDELFHFPFSEHLSLRQLISYLENNQYTAVRSLLLDVYPDTPIGKIKYKKGDDPLKYCNYFDPDYLVRKNSFFDKKRWEKFTTRCYLGGVRSRIFRKFNKNWLFCITKIPFFKYTDSTYLVQGMHALSKATFADIEGVVIHTKFLHDFIERVKEEAKRQEHFRNAIEYKIYDYHLKKNSQILFKNKNSLKYKNTQQLIEDGIMKSSQYFNQFNKSQR